MRETARRSLRWLVIAAAGGALAALGACTTLPGGFPDQPPPLQATADPSVVALREKLAEGARTLLGKRQVVVRGRHFTPDCTGLVLGIYWYAGIDLAKDFRKFTGDGVARIYKTLDREGLLYSTSHPLVGDIIFWDNTYDNNQTLLPDNPLSHIGMVVGVDDDGTIAYIHYHVTRGIVVEYMNLENPDVQSMMVNGRMKVINSPMRLAVPGRPHADKWLAGQLYRALGLGYLLE